MADKPRLTPPSTPPPGSVKPLRGVGIAENRGSASSKKKNKKKR
jgi:hypothetical protein